MQHNLNIQLSSFKLNIRVSFNFKIKEAVNVWIDVILLHIFINYVIKYDSVIIIV